MQSAGAVLSPLFMQPSITMPVDLLIGLLRAHRTAGLATATSDHDGD